MIRPRKFFPKAISCVNPVSLLLLFFSKDTPPVYDATKVITPTAFFFGGHDTLSNKTDVEALMSKLPPVKYHEFLSKWNHIDFVFGIDAKELLYDKLVDLMAEL